MNSWRESWQTSHVDCQVAVEVSVSAKPWLPRVRGESKWTRLSAARSSVLKSPLDPDPFAMRPAYRVVAALKIAPVALIQVPL
jgi:hypothetical protein